MKTGGTSFLVIASRESAADSSNIVEQSFDNDKPKTTKEVTGMQE